MVAKLLPVILCCVFLASFALCSPNAADVLKFKREAAISSCGAGQLEYRGGCCTTCTTDADCTGGKICVPILNLLGVSLCFAPCGN
ncbi:hypothetical protein niasHT_010173 [Heterodera trifolii]|uniref:Uncharacterized protein n=1 Tax=Heterodera trifolii TaxID=157864 RepID=A0ABD2LWF5_9BILA